MYIGKHLKELRESQKMTLTELAEKSGVQIATLSRIEHEKMIGTLESHMKIAEALGIELPQLYEGGVARPAEAVSPAPLGVESFSYNEKAAYEMLTTNLSSKKMMPVILRIEPGGRTQPEQYRQGSERFIFVLEGKLTIKVDDGKYDLGRNQALYFRGANKHSFENAGQKVVKAVSVLSPVEL